MSTYKMLHAVDPDVEYDDPDAITEGCKVREAGLPDDEPCTRSTKHPSLWGGPEDIALCPACWCLQCKTRRKGEPCPMCERREQGGEP